jgi:proteasome lid subunit RPN8/RPN11
MTSGCCELPRSVVNAVATHARVAAPAECCGVLIGRGHRIIDAVPAKNLSDDPAKYVLDPAAQFHAQRTARAKGLEVVGFYHSHPHSAPAPSDTDLREAYPEVIYLIAGLVGDGSELRAYTAVDGKFDELVLDIVAPR